MLKVEEAAANAAGIAVMTTKSNYIPELQTLQDNESKQNGGNR